MNTYQLTLITAARAAYYDTIGKKIRSVAEETARQEQELEHWWEAQGLEDYDDESE